MEYVNSEIYGVSAEKLTRRYTMQNDEGEQQSVLGLTVLYSSFRSAARASQAQTRDTFSPRPLRAKKDIRLNGILCTRQIFRATTANLDAADSHAATGFRVGTDQSA